MKYRQKNFSGKSLGKRYQSFHVSREIQNKSPFHVCKAVRGCFGIWGPFSESPLLGWERVQGNPPPEQVGGEPVRIRDRSTPLGRECQEPGSEKFGNHLEAGVGRGTGVPVGCSHPPGSARGLPKPGMETLPAPTPHSIPFTCLARGCPQHPCPTLEERPGKCQCFGGLQKGRLLFPRPPWQPDVTGLGWGPPFWGA